MERTLITVIIPTYNRADYLPRTVESVLRQTHQPLQVLILDDCSTDHTPEVATRLAGDPRVHYVRHTKNLGMAPNWRYGLAQIRTPYFCLLNDDDLLAPDFIETLIAPMEADPEIIVSFCDHHVIDENDRPMPRLAAKSSRLYHRENLPEGKVARFGEATVLHRSLHVSCSILRTSNVPPEFIDERAGGSACGWMFYQCYRTGKSGYYHPKRLVSYRIHSGNMVSNPGFAGYINEGQIFWCEQLLQDELPDSLREKVNQQIARIFNSFAMGLSTTGDRQRAAVYFKRAEELHPTFKAKFGLFLLSMGPVGDWTLVQIRKAFHAIRRPMISLLFAGASMAFLVAIHER